MEGGELRASVLGTSRERLAKEVACRALDLVATVALVLLLAPLLLLIALIIKLDSPGPVLFRQQRVGRGRRNFLVAKFRTMQHGADHDVHRDYMLALIESGTPAPKLAGDARVTRFGAFLRRTSLDELPQLWNVLRGEMSVVGPRPPLPREVVGYDIWHRRRLSMKPGITGLWQVAARRDPDFDRWVRLDLDYIDHWSLWLDLKIVARTIPAMLTGEGR